MTTEPETILALADRVVVMKKRTIVREFAAEPLRKDHLHGSVMVISAVCSGLARMLGSAQQEEFDSYTYSTRSPRWSLAAPVYLAARAELETR